METVDQKTTPERNLEHAAAVGCNPDAGQTSKQRMVQINSLIELRFVCHVARVAMTWRCRLFGYHVKSS